MFKKVNYFHIKIKQQQKKVEKILNPLSFNFFFYFAFCIRSRKLSCMKIDLFNFFFFYIFIVRFFFYFRNFHSTNIK